MRIRLSQIAAGLAVLLGVLGLWRGTVIAGVPEGQGAPSATSSATPGAQGIAVTGATVVASAGPTTQLRLVLRNDTGQDDTLLSLSAGAGLGVTLSGPGVTPGGIDVAAGAALVIGAGPAGGQITATITGMLGPLSVGQQVALSLELRSAGAVLAQATVVAS